MTTRSMTLALALAAAACRPDPGLPDYSTMAGLRDAGADDGGLLPGPSPYVPGTRRLALGLFYEGGASESLALDDGTRHYYIFGLEGSGTLTYAQEASSDRVEGLAADRLVMAGTPWWGGGIVWDAPTDLSGWRTLHVSLASSDPGLSAIQLRLLHGEGSAREALVEAGDHGWAADGAWHHLAIPLAAFGAKGADLTRVRGPFLIGGVGAGGGEAILVDNLYVD
jgi:hypothetical protein